MDKPSLKNRAAVSRFLCLLAICALADTALAQPENVELKISDAGTLEMQSDSQCKTSTIGKPNYPHEKGCVRFMRGDRGNLTFRLVNQKVCDETTRPPTQWQLDEVRFANKDGLEPTTSQWENPTVPLDADVQADYEVNPADGVVRHTVNVDGSISIYNNNTKNFYVWYRVRATCKGDVSSAIYYDPRADNEGEPN